jgi:hypothetical protein
MNFQMNKRSSCTYNRDWVNQKNIWRENNTQHNNPSPQSKENDHIVPNSLEFIEETVRSSFKNN